MKWFIHVCKVRNKIKSYIAVKAKQMLANLMPYDKIVSSCTHIIVRLPKTEY